ncbi:hypothetical protein AB0H97_03735 [Streptomyces sp. NPDC050788]|jgi:hypothetical protein|uniref:hypothetical protein n=1 Tax=Streptomyces sp. NPDC050788 TaxID=3155041 RepID=UPI003444FF12
MSYTVYGVRRLAPRDVAEIVSAKLAADFTLRESSYKGGEYFIHRTADGVEISIEKQFSDEEGELSEPDFPEYATFVYVNRGKSEIDRQLNELDQLHQIRSEMI